MTNDQFVDVQIKTPRDEFTVDVAFGLKKGELVALVGPNGAGKSTVARVICGIEQAAEAKITIDDQVVELCTAQRQEKWLPPEKRSAAMVFQSVELFRSHSVIDNIAFGLRARKVRKSIAREQARTLLSEFHLDDLELRDTASLSGGEAQMISLLRAMVTNPKLLLLDEPFSALDTVRRAEIRQLFDQWRQRTATTTLMISHEAEDAVDLARHLIVMDRGNIAANGPIAEIVANPPTAHSRAMFGFGH
ncbi:MAG: hypothetical protein RLZZ31_968 [Actinomycetota bacterium]